MVAFLLACIIGLCIGIAIHQVDVDLDGYGGEPEDKDSTLSE